MKLNTVEFQNLLKRAYPFAWTMSATNIVMTHFLITWKDWVITLRALDVEWVFEWKCKYEWDDITLLLPAKQFFNVVMTVSDEVFEIIVNKWEILVKSKKTKLKVKSASVDKMNLPDMSWPKKIVTIDGKLFVDNLVKISPMILSKAYNLLFTGAAIIQNWKNIYFSAINSFYLMLKKSKDIELLNDWDFIFLSKDILVKMLKSLSKDEEVKITTSWKNMLIEQWEISIYTQTYEINIPPVFDKIPDHKNHVVFDPSVMINKLNFIKQTYWEDVTPMINLKDWEIIIEWKEFWELAVECKWEWEKTVSFFLIQIIKVLSQNRWDVKMFFWDNNVVKITFDSAPDELFLISSLNI